MQYLGGTLDRWCLSWLMRLLVVEFPQFPQFPPVSEISEVSGFPFYSPRASRARL
jgi:hypothetical protein